ncbi:DUF3152 domain-containing protein [Actinocorallia sp. B10E7]|uniref:DUF3152 domain-containing protein n=1 Tax=Actinocorallia sp. B10E7 TaxID=3153558 RepID=UPI00325C8F73
MGSHRRTPSRLRRHAGTALAVAATSALTLIARAAPTPVPLPTPAPPTASPRPPVRPLVVNGRLQPAPRAVPLRASGGYLPAPGTDEPLHHRHRTTRYLVEVEKGLPFTPEEFARDVHRILTDPRGWPTGFLRVDRGPVDLRVSLTSPAHTRRHCRPLTVGLRLSCWQGGRAVINAARWARGAASYGHDLATYREYLINHEVGHALGHGHRTCPGPGRPAPVMVQQSISLYGCSPNPWPRRHIVPRIDHSHSAFASMLRPLLP